MTAMPEAYRTIVDPLIVAAREILERGESLVPFAFVGNLTTKETQPVRLGTGSAEQKDESAHLKGSENGPPALGSRAATVGQEQARGGLRPPRKSLMRYPFRRRATVVGPASGSFWQSQLTRSPPTTNNIASALNAYSSTAFNLPAEMATEVSRGEL